MVRIVFFIIDGECHLFYYKGALVLQQIDRWHHRGKARICLLNIARLTRTEPMLSVRHVDLDLDVRIRREVMWQSSVGLAIEMS